MDSKYVNNYTIFNKNKLLILVSLVAIIYMKYREGHTEVLMKILEAKPEKSSKSPIYDTNKEGDTPLMYGRTFKSLKNHTLKTIKSKQKYSL